MALMAFDTGFLVLGVVVVLGIRMLAFPQQRAGDAVLEVAELEIGVMLGNLVYVLEREVVGALVGHPNWLAGGRISTRIAVVLDVALAALQFGVVAVEQCDLAGVAAHAQVLDLDLCTALIFVP